MNLHDVFNDFISLFFFTIVIGFTMNKVLVYFAYHSNVEHMSRWKEYRGNMLALFITFFVFMTVSTILTYDGIFKILHNIIGFVMFVLSTLYFCHLEKRHTDKIFSEKTIDKQT